MNSELTIENLKDPIAFGVALKRIRKKKGLSQAELAEKMNMRQPTISDIESGRGTLDSVFKIIQALKINITISTSSNLTRQKSTSKISSILDQFED